MLITIVSPFIFPLLTIVCLRNKQQDSHRDERCRSGTNGFSPSVRPMFISWSSVLVETVGKKTGKHNSSLIVEGRAAFKCLFFSLFFTLKSLPKKMKIFDELLRGLAFLVASYKSKTCQSECNSSCLFYALFVFKTLLIKGLRLKGKQKELRQKLITFTSWHSCQSPPHPLSDDALKMFSHQSNFNDQVNY